MFGLLKKIFSRSNHSGIFRAKIEKITGIKIKNLALYIEAFTHRSVSRGGVMGRQINYERLEFLGDAVLGAVIAHWLYEQAPNGQEGYLTQTRSKIVNRKNLNAIAEQIGLSTLVRSRATDGKDILGDVLEALVGAIYQDYGYEVCQTFIRKRIIDPYINLERIENQIASYKSLLIEWSQKNKKTVRFETFEEINAEEKTVFCSQLYLDEKIVARGRANSKKLAEELAAKRTYFTMQEELKKKQD